jgi:hypothetical protein
LEGLKTADLLCSGSPNQTGQIRHNHHPAKAHGVPSLARSHQVGIG